MIWSQIQLIANTEIFYEVFPLSSITISHVNLEGIHLK